jgi:hypothetical protein
VQLPSVIGELSPSVFQLSAPEGLVPMIVSTTANGFEQWEPSSAASRIIPLTIGSTTPILDAPL